MKNSKHIHFVGIKGVGVMPLAIIAKEAGFTVSGSDIARQFITDTILEKHGIVPFIDFDASHIRGADLVITTGAHGGYDNIEVQEAKRKNIPILTQGEAVGEFMKGKMFGKTYTGISVTGTHGKTTVSAMVAHIFNFAKKDPSWVIGTSEVPSLGDAGHFGNGEYFVAEADEYATEPQYDKTPKFMWQHPRYAIITNIEHDHPDVYPNLSSVTDAFLQFAKQLFGEGVLITCGDDPEVQKLLKQFSGQTQTYGFEKHNIYQLQHVAKDKKGIEWEVLHNGKAFSLSLPIPGEHNALNATAAYICALMEGIPKDTIRLALREFKGTKRRMEYVGQAQSGALLYDDYGHHPTEIRKTLQSISEKYPNKQIVCIFQPHTYSRTKLLFDQFVDSLSYADVVILVDIYPSAREGFDSTVSSAMLVEELIKRGKSAVLAPRLSDVVKYIRAQVYKEDTVIVTMGAGDIYQIANEILENLSVR